MPETTNVDYSTKIPNNVGLMDDQRVLKALEQWHPGYIDWWMSMGPDGLPGGADQPTRIFGGGDDLLEKW